MDIETDTTMRAIRLPDNPIIRPDMNPQLGGNINGPSLIRVPDWLPNPLGRYYLYFAHHQGTYIRLAYADAVEGPWRIYSPGTLQLDQTACVGHIGSPDVHIDHEHREIVLYFHGPVSDTVRNFRGQRSFRAVSADGIHFTADDTVLGPFYFRVFQHDGSFYALAKSIVAEGGGVLLRSKDGVTPFEQGPDLLPRQRHVAVQKQGDRLRIFYTRGRDAPESILMTEMALTGDWRTWTPGESTVILSPDEEWEGGSLPTEPSDFGGVHKPVRQLRDPAVYTEDGATWLLYSVAGEQGIAIARLEA